jgi:hypothetical protein
MLVRCLRVVGDCRRRSVREGGGVCGGGVGTFEEEEEEEGVPPGVGDAAVLVAEGVECAM